MTDLNQNQAPDIDSSTDDYATRFSGKVGQWFLNVQEQGTLSLLKNIKEASILDVGGGHGQTLPALIANGYKVTILGSDQSCSKRINPYLNNQNAFFKIGSLTDIPFPDQSFDVALSYRILPHLTDWKKLIKELTRVSKNYVLVDFPTLYSFNLLSSLFFPLKKKIEKNTRTYKIFPEKEIIAEFKTNGFIPAGKYAQFLFPMALYRAINNHKISSGLETLFRTIGLTQLLGSPVLYLFKKLA